MGKLSRYAISEMANYVVTQAESGEIGMLQPVLPASQSQQDVEEWLAAEESEKWLSLTPDGPAEDGRISFNGGAVVLTLE